jgi:1,4-alpha-glucan branching enzyme
VTNTLRLGPLLTGGGVTFRLWAPGAREVSVLVDEPFAMTRHGDWFETHPAAAVAGTRYRFRIDGEIEIPDPAGGSKTNY